MSAPCLQHLSFQKEVLTSALSLYGGSLQDSFLHKPLFHFKTMTTLHLLSHVDGIFTAAMRLYAIGGELFNITAILFCLNFMANLIRHTYNAGYQVGKFYRQHLHKPLRWLLIHAIALIILLSQLAWEGAVVIYTNRREILDGCANAWHQVERLFIYEYA